MSSEIEAPKNDNMDISPNEVTNNPELSPEDINGKKRQISKKQEDHLKFARAVKKLQSEEKKKMETTLNTSLDFIYQRLTNIEKQMTSLPVLGKRRREEDPEDETPVTKKEVVKKEPVSWVSIFVQAGILFGSSLIITYLKNGTTRKSNSSTMDGDSLYVPTDQRTSYTWNS